MAYVKATNGVLAKYPYSVGELRRDNPNTSFPRQVPDKLLASYDVYPVTIKTAPAIDDRTQRVSQNREPVLVDGVWTIDWTVEDKTAEEIQAYDNTRAAQVRSRRNSLLSATDWVVIFHTEKGTNIPLEVEVYRQALRDITSHANFPELEEADWPVKPEGL